MEPAYDPNRRYALIVRLPREIAARIEDTYLRLASITKPTMGFHITLLGPFFLGRGMTHDSLRGVAQACGRWRPFSVEVTGVGVFANSDDNTVYLQVTDPTDIIMLHEDLARATAEQIVIPEGKHRRWNYEEYCPHVTLGQRLSDREVEEFSGNASRQRFREVFRVNCVSLVRQERTGPWQYLGDYPLGAGEEATGCENPYIPD